MKALFEAGAGLVLLPGTVHLWCFDLEPAADAARLWAVLDAAERERARRLQSPLREHFVGVRGCLRCLLGRYLRVPPEAVRLIAGEHGKPRIEGTAPDCGLVFNLSHSGSKAILALARDRALGCDLELWREIARPGALIERCFGAAEQRYWYGLDLAERKRALFEFWTRKEAFAKAVGRGLGVGLRDCVFRPGPKPGLQTLPRVYGSPDEWQVFDIDLGAGVSAAVVVSGARPTLVRWRLNRRWLLAGEGSAQPAAAESINDGGRATTPAGGARHHQDL